MVAMDKMDSTKLSIAGSSLAALLLGAYYIRKSIQLTPFERQVLDERKYTIYFVDDNVAYAESEFLSDHTELIDCGQARLLRSIHVPPSIDRPSAPLIVFIHGLGGQAAQFEPQLEYFSQGAHVLAIDLLGCGRSAAPKNWSFYKPENLVKDFIHVINHYRQQLPGHPLVIVAHSYGCALATIAAKQLGETLQALVLVSPKYDMEQNVHKVQKYLPYVPDWFMDRLRRADRKGGLNSKSVLRFTGPEGDTRFKRLQLRWNLMSTTPVYKRFASSARFASPEEYNHVKCRVFLIGGSMDTLTPPSDMTKIHAHLSRAETPVVIEGSRHMPMWSHTSTLNAAINDFLSSVCQLDVRL
ncbi:Alpha/Beta hydrolase protein [Syncephalastrum racemosum]|uniref:Alpha/Beta hydrolase protein n=1 Tax=Syncephalastrum racemosum TaxID=13706 RepID=A0A1X2H443_SYNRA|nr:Alpha/Beta hydrolase protein [Syncephalastrum racemosum]